MSSVKIQSIQAVEFVEFDMPEGDGGVRLFRGSNGAGKTTALQCIEALLGRKVNLSASRGAPEGSIEGLGVTKKIKQKTTTKGDVEVACLEGRFDFSSLVDPPIKDPAAKNKARIRALVGLAGRKATVDDFRELFVDQDQFAAIGEMVSDGDPLEMADEIKKHVERQARDIEAKIEQDTSRWKLAVEQAKGHKPKDEPKAVKQLADEYAAAAEAVKAAESKRQAIDQATAENARTQSQIERHQAERPAMSAADLAVSVKEARATVVQLEEALRVAIATKEAVERDFKASSAWESRLRELEAQVVDIDDEVPEIEPLKAKADAALKSLQDAEEIKQRWDAAVRAQQYKESIATNAEQAKQLRDVAASTGKIVSKFLPTSCPLVVNADGVLGVHDADGSWEAMSDLSEGERWEVALSVAIEAVGPGGVIPCDQNAWQSLDSESKAEVARRCKEACVYLVSGEVADGPLRVESYEPEREWNAVAS